MTAPRIGIIILSWNNTADTLRCLRSVFACDYEAFQVITVDNGSQDDSIAAIREHYPDLIILENKQNWGYTGGNNIGLEYALNQGVDYVLLLNDDAVVEQGMLSALVATAEAHPQAGFLGPKICSLEEPRLLLSAGGQLHEGWKSAHRGMGDLDEGQYDELVEVDFLSGCTLLASRKAIETIGFLDDDFFAYHEDIEWCCRGKKAGFEVLFVPGAKVWHPDTRHRDEHSPLVTYYTTRNHLLFVAKYRSGIGGIVRILATHLRTLTSWSMRPRWRRKRAQRDALAWAILDFALGRFGKAERFG